MRKSVNQLTLVLKTQRHLERDLIVTVLTREQGRIMTVAKGVRQIKSARRSLLEPGNLIHAQYALTTHWPILTQGNLVASGAQARRDLNTARRFFQFLEILDRLLVSEEIPPVLFQQILYVRELLLVGASNTVIREHFEMILRELGFVGDNEHTSIAAQVNAILDSDLRSFDYLSVR